MGMKSKDLVANYRPLKEIAQEMGYNVENFKSESNEELKRTLKKKIGEDYLPEEIVREMAAQKLIRAVESRRQLKEVLADFWYNHFNIDITKGQDKWLLPEYEREVIRPHLFGKFSDMLSATAHSPAMLFYLDNHLSRGPKEGNKDRLRFPEKPKPGLNENYAREILELHTLGVDGGYTQKDVTELARILTGWSIEDKKNPVFDFKAKFHDKGQKTFLNTVFPAGHMQDEGERAIAMIANHPSTANFIALKLCRAFVADNPPKAFGRSCRCSFHKN